ncbi:MAG: spore germination protein KA [Eubacteriales bacterium SKADARSKE-1]|nr:spore germination protein KA [Eubacteriales bacterium SKADARSKE-1]
MFYLIKNILERKILPGTEKKLIKKIMPVSGSLEENLTYFESSFENCIDLRVRKFKIKSNNAAIITLDGMVDKETLAISVLNPILKSNLPENEQILKQYEYMKDEVLSTSEQMECFNYEDAMSSLMAGCTLFLIEGVPRILSIEVQGFESRPISEPVTEVTQKGSREGFVEKIKVNITLIRRRIKNPNLKFERMVIGSVSKTPICLFYLDDMVSPKILDDVKKRLKEVNLKYVLSAEYLIPYLEEKNSFSLFNAVWVSERPDSVCGKISEGRIGILVDGAPNAVILPYLFAEYFQTMDDYNQRPYFASLIRILKYMSFFISMLLPGIYVALGTFNPEVFPTEVINKLAASIGDTPFPLLFETLIILFIYEIMREAGLRLPRALGHAVSIVGALVIGETAVTSGLIGAPTLMVVALTAISSYVIPNLYEPVALLRLVFAVVGGVMGVLGITLLFTMTLIGVCAKNNYGVPFTTSISPFKFGEMRDVFIRAGWKVLSRNYKKVQNTTKNK